MSKNYLGAHSKQFRKTDALWNALTTEAFIMTLALAARAGCSDHTASSNLRKWESQGLVESRKIAGRLGTDWRKIKEV